MSKGDPSDPGHGGGFGSGPVHVGVPAVGPALSHLGYFHQEG